MMEICYPVPNHFVWNPLIDNILSTGKPLESIGVSNYALNRSDALVALAQLLACKIPVLGGDVYIENDVLLEQNYDNWHCDKNPFETNQEFLSRSIAIAEQYIQLYTIPNALFALVPKL